MEIIILLLMCFVLTMKIIVLFVAKLYLREGAASKNYVAFFFFFLISHYQSTAGGDLSMLSPVHAGFEPTPRRWLSASQHVNLLL